MTKSDDPSKNPRDRLVTVKRFPTTFEANLALAVMREAGIPATLSGEMVNEMIPLNVADREVDLLVAENQLQAAHDALANVKRLESDWDVEE